MKFAAIITGLLFIASVIVLLTQPTLWIIAGLMSIGWGTAFIGILVGLRRRRSA